MAWSLRSLVVRGIADRSAEMLTLADTGPTAAAPGGGRRNRRRSAVRGARPTVEQFNSRRNKPFTPAALKVLPVYDGLVCRCCPSRPEHCS
ncbi:hypothetical protein [Streptomyces sp. MBT62]|uniref:hypothetical protein n=1 Tax=Streptomyces sp. MBT62 TaxID=2800410 RepID=UPI00190D1403|nr:hypothetical protein [Streptomyces sp. MBT62]MBK3571774.1 hypothetical protein [Streptomyces sp. MBT62]